MHALYLLIYLFEEPFANLGLSTAVWLTWWSDENNDGDTHDTGKYLGIYALMQALCLGAIYWGARWVFALNLAALHGFILDVRANIYAVMLQSQWLCDLAKGSTGF